ncbi:hypothetical protein PSP20601_05385 [Pandoraea sputorum]|nr:hypothetical protein PSP20601_05385 [Pandoraea sputorum]
MQEVIPKRIVHEVSLTGELQLLQYTSFVGTDGFRTDTQHLGDLSEIQPARKHQEDIKLAVREAAITGTIGHGTRQILRNFLSHRRTE